MVTMQPEFSTYLRYKIFTSLLIVHMAMFEISCPFVNSCILLLANLLCVCVCMSGLFLSLCCRLSNFSLCGYVLHSTVLYCIVLYCIVLYCIVLHCFIHAGVSHQSLHFVNSIADFN